MYLNLLASAMDDRVAKSLGHPGFVEIIKQLNETSKVTPNGACYGYSVSDSRNLLYGRYGILTSLRLPSIGIC